ENFFEPVEVFFFDSVAAQILVVAEDSVVVVVPTGISQGFVRLNANGGTSLSPQRFFTARSILVNDFDGGGLRAETNKWVFRGSINQNASNAVQSSNPDPFSGNFLHLTGTDNLNISWIGGAQNHVGFPGETFETFGISTSANNTILEFDANSNGKAYTNIILILLEKDGSPNDFTYEMKVDWSGWKHVAVPLNRFKDLNDAIVNPTKVRVIKVHMIDKGGTKKELEINIDNLTFTEIL
ncbi:MAG: glycan-binding surface protein, partial [Bacteroidia bacterium]|nr:glycan-binding surface protein [Bacteroidia bacterium]